MSALPPLPLPDSFRPYFWDVDFGALDRSAHRDFIVGRILSAGSWEAITELREQLGDDPLREWLVRHRGGDLSPRQIRLWELLLDLPEDEVETWLAARRGPWWERHGP